MGYRNRDIFSMVEEILTIYKQVTLFHKHTLSICIAAKITLMILATYANSTNLKKDGLRQIILLQTYLLLC